MNTTNHDPAFPAQWIGTQPTTGEQVVREQWAGLTKLELVSAIALQGLLSSAQGYPTFEDYTKCAVNHAETLLAECARRQAT